MSGAVPTWLPPLLILLGAVLMAVNILKFRSLANAFRNFVPEEYESVRTVHATHQLLMVFFLLGYLAVLAATVLSVPLVGDLFVGAIFFFGSVFVLLGIEVQSRMFASLRSGLMRTMDAREDLETHATELLQMNERLRDEIAERRRLEKERLGVEEKLHRAEKMEAVGLVAAGVAHDLNNILSGLVTRPSLVLMDLPEDSPIREDMVAILDAGERAANVVGDLLALARRGHAAMEGLDLGDVVAGWLTSAEHDDLLANHPDLRLDVALATGALPIQGSAPHLVNVLTNLVKNAAEAMPDGGAVRITTSRRTAPDASSSETGLAVLSVSDEGVGILPEDVARIVEPFFTKKPAGRRGTGLGLTVAWNTVEDHGGTLDVESRVGQGSTFEVLLPIDDRAPSAQGGEEPAEDDGSWGRGESVLVVDDLADQRAVALASLNKHGFRAEAVGSGEAALDALEAEAVDLVLLDMMMEPGMDGLDTLTRIRELRPGQAVLIVTGFSGSEKLQETRRLGALGCLDKPYSAEALARAVRRALDDRGSDAKPS